MAWLIPQESENLGDEYVGQMKRTMEPRYLLFFRQLVSDFAFSCYLHLNRGGESVGVVFRQLYNSL